MTEQVEGACFCGAVEFNVELPAIFCGHCHCTMCRRSHGAAYVTWFVVRRDQFSFKHGEDKLIRFASSDHGTRSFCRVCGSSLFCESTHHPERIDIVLANMKAAIGIEPQAHIYFDCRADWVRVEDSLPRLGGPTGIEPLG
jgi:hypothetical protein